MFSHLLVPVDGTELSDRAAEVSLDLARKLGAKVTGFVVEPTPPLPTRGAGVATYQRDSEAHRARTEAHAQSVLAKFGERAAAAGVAFEGQFSRTDSVDDAIIKAADEYQCDLIVMVTHGRGVFGELLFGSHTKAVLSRSKLPLLVLH